jgi:hypothetical protein
MAQKARARQQRSRMASKRSRARLQKGRSASRKAAAAAAKGRQAARSRRQPAAAKRRKAAEKRGLEIFDQQIGALWDRFTNECRQFAEGFNQEIGSHQLQLEENPAGLMVKLPTDGAEVFFQLDRAERHVQCVMTSGCTSFGSCITEQAPMGLTIMDGRLQFVYDGLLVSEEELAVNLLTRLVESGTPTAR